MRHRNLIHTLLLPGGLRLDTYDDSDKGELWRGDELLGSRVHWTAYRIRRALWYADRRERAEHR